MNPVKTIFSALLFALIFFSLSNAREKSRVSYAANQTNNDDKAKLPLTISQTNFNSTYSSGGTEFEGIKKINGTDIFCKVIGTGEPIVIVHGGPGLGYEYLYPHFKRLADKFQLIFYDQRGCGRSASFNPGDTTTIEQFVDDLEAIRKEFGIEKMDLAGQSFGARIAISYTLKYPAAVKKLILLEPAYGSSEYLQKTQQTIMERLSPSAKEELMKIAQSSELKNYEVNAVKKLVSLRLATYYYDTTKINHNYLDYFDNARARKFMLTQSAIVKEQLNFNLYGGMKEITCPTFIMRGDYDPIPLESIEKMHKEIKNSELYVIKNCGHFAHIEKPEEYFSAIEKFLE